MALSCSHFGNPRLCFSLKMAELAYGLHYNLSPEPTKKTVKGWILKTLTRKDKKKSGGKQQQQQHFWRWKADGWVLNVFAEPRRLRFKWMVWGKQMQPTSHC